MNRSIKQPRLLPGLERRQPPVIMAHRGVMAWEPENTRTTDRSGPVAEMTVAELARARTLDRDGGPTEEGIPTLESFLSIIPPGRGVALEIKDDRIAGPGLGARVVDLVGAAGMEERVRWYLRLGVDALLANDPAATAAALAEARLGG